MEGTKEVLDPRFTPQTQAFCACTICDAEYPADTESCPKCHSILSKVRRCPECRRILSSRHQTCIYCATSFLAIHQLDRHVELESAAPRMSSARRKELRGIMVGLVVFLLIVFVGAIWVFRSQPASGTQTLATSYAVKKANLRLNPDSRSGIAEAIPTGTILSLTKVKMDQEGRRWFGVWLHDRETYLSTDEIAPPKVDQAESGYELLRDWLLSFHDQQLSGDATDAVNFYCARFPGPSHCDELRWVAAERFRSLAASSPHSSKLMENARSLYKDLAAGKGTHAGDSSRLLSGAGQGDEDSAERSTKPAKSQKTSATAAKDGRHYALVDTAEVAITIPEFRSAQAGGIIRAPIANEIRINGQVAVPSDAICVLQVVNWKQKNAVATVRLIAIEIAGKRYPVDTTAQEINSGGSRVSYRLNSSILINR